MVLDPKDHAREINEAVIVVMFVPQKAEVLGAWSSV
jgi:hypothetical protein